MENQINFQCVKCSSTEYKTGQIHVTGGTWARFFNFQSNRFTTLSCGNCGYTEFYKKKSSTGSNILDVLGS